MSKEVLKKLAEHDKRFDEHDKRFDEHDRRFDAIDKRLTYHDEYLERLTAMAVNHESRLERIEYEIVNNMATKADLSAMRSDIMITLDKLMGLMLKRDQEMAFVNARFIRIEEKIGI